MERTPFCLLLYAIAACTPKGDPQETAQPSVDDTDSDSDSDSDSDADTDSDSDADSDSDSDADPPSWRLHKEIGSLIYFSWTQPSESVGRVEYRFEKDWVAIPERLYSAGRQEELVLGVPFETGASLRVVYDTSAPEITSEELLAETGSLPARLPLPSLLVNEPKLQEPSGRYLLGSINADTGGWDEGEYWMFIVDRQGRFVWASRAEGRDFTIYLRTSLDGDILWDVSTYWSEFDGGASSHINRMKIDGVVTATYEAPGMHHCFVEMPDRSILWGSATSDSEDILRQTLDGDVETVWSCSDLYDDLGLYDWCHTNSIFYHEPTDTLLLSFPTDRTFVLDLDMATGEPIRWFGHIPESWDFDPPESAFEYQHGATWTDEGTLLLSSQRSPRSVEGVVREYALDEEEETLVEIWNHGEGDGISANYAGEAHRLPFGNTLHNTGTTPRVREITPAGEIAWDLAWEGYRLIGRTTFLEDLYTLAP